MSGEKIDSSAKPRKIAIIGNSGGGKSTLARKLAQQLDLPVTHVDAIQFVAGMKIRPHKESIQIIEEIQNREAWIIDGYGPLDILEKRLALADLVIFIDLPLWQHYWWATRRHIRNLWQPREELPADCNELTWAHTKKLYHSLWQVHKKMRPEMLRILSRENLRSKVRHIRTEDQLNQINIKGL